MATLDQGGYGAQLSSAKVNTGLMRSITIPLKAANHSADSDPSLTSGVSEFTLDGSTETIAFSFLLPADYDGRRNVSGELYPGDVLKVRVLAIATTTATNTLEIDDIRYWRDAGTAVVDPTLSTAQGASQTVAITAMDFYEFDLNGLSLLAGDAVTITLGCTIAGNNILVRGIEVMYRGHLITTEETRR